MKMDALVKTEAAKGLTLMQVEKPTPKPGEVLIKIHKTAICGTDLHIYNWDAWSQKHVKPPCIIGHEYVGEIEALGDYVKGFEVGERVSGEGHIVCGHCRNCRAGNGQWCRNTEGVGVQRDGAFAEYICIPASNCIPISKDLPEDIVAFFDAFGNATHTALMFDVIGEDVLITGAGPIGIMAAAICRKNGARNVIITDVNDFRLDLAKKLGATATVNVAKEDLNEVMKKHNMVEGFDVGLEMSGAASALSQMIENMRNGGSIALLGLFGNKQPQLEMDDIILKGLTLKGIYGRRMFETWYKMGAMIEAGLDLSALITHKFHYTEFEKAFEIMNTGNSGKIILDWRK
ncbi:MAG: L-threonine 3-dehydrogenase [Eubacteriales bacterium]|nr:L-threonine 3-dehydrogenase [Eubacteriales bacterium]